MIIFPEKCAYIAAVIRVLGMGDKNVVDISDRKAVILYLRPDNLQRSGNTGVCKTPMRGFDSRSGLEYLTVVFGLSLVYAG